MEQTGQELTIQQPPIDLRGAGDSPTYFVTLIAGLEPIAADEITQRLPDARLLGALRGKLFFAWDGPPAAGADLLTVEHLLACVAQLCGIPADERGPQYIEAQIRELDLTRALALYHELHGEPDRPSFRITASRSGSHEYNSLEIAAAAGAGVVQRYGWDVDLEQYDYDLRVYVTDDTAVVGLRLTEEALHRRARVKHAAASLNATVAAAMCRLAGQPGDEVFCDPMCGAGTVLIERARLGGDPLLVGGELFEEPLAMALTNLRSAAVRANLVRWDARHMALATQSVDRLVCNMPWGRRVGSHRVNRHLYPGFVRGLSRVLAPDGRAVLLTQERRLLTRLIGRSSRLRFVAQHTLSLGGLYPVIYVVEPRG